MWTAHAHTTSHVSRVIRFKNSPFTPGGKWAERFKWESLHRSCIMFLILTVHIFLARIVVMEHPPPQPSAPSPPPPPPPRNCIQIYMGRPLVDFHWTLHVHNMVRIWSVSWNDLYLPTTPGSKNFLTTALAASIFCALYASQSTYYRGDFR